MHDLGRQFDAIAVALGIARRCGAPGPLLAAAEGALEELAVIAGMADSRRVTTFQRGLRIAQLREQGRTRSQICAVMGISRESYRHCRREWCELHTLGSAGFGHLRKEPAMDLKSVSLGIGAGTPAPMSKYGSAARPVAPRGETPRDAGMMADGSTGGNYSQNLKAIGVNGTGVAAAAAESAQATMEGNGQ